MCHPAAWSLRVCRLRAGVRVFSTFHPRLLLVKFQSLLLGVNAPSLNSTALAWVSFWADSDSQLGEAAAALAGLCPSMYVCSHRCCVEKGGCVYKVGWQNRRLCNFRAFSSPHHKTRLGRQQQSRRRDIWAQEVCCFLRRKGGGTPDTFGDRVPLLAHMRSQGPASQPRQQQSVIAPRTLTGSSALCGLQVLMLESA